MAAESYPFWGDAEGAAPVSGKRILLVDDQEDVLQLAALFLHELGHTPVRFHDSTEAWEAFRAAPESFDVVLADLTMPRMSGVELARRIAALRPETPVYICTGFGENGMPEGAPPGVRGVIHKPYSMAALAEAIEKPRSRTAGS